MFSLILAAKGDWSCQRLEREFLEIAEESKKIKKIKREKYLKWNPAFLQDFKRKKEGSYTTDLGCLLLLPVLPRDEKTTFKGEKAEQKREKVKREKENDCRKGVVLPIPPHL